MDNNINNDIDDKTGEVENVVKSDYNEETLEDVVDGNVIKAKDTEKWSESVELRKSGYGRLESWGKQKTGFHPWQDSESITQRQVESLYGDSLAQNLEMARHVAGRGVLPAGRMKAAG